MKMRPLSKVLFLSVLLLPATGLSLTTALAADNQSSPTAPAAPASSAPAPAPAQGGSRQPGDHHEPSDDRPRIEEHREGLQGIELFILGGAFVAALGIAFRVGKLSTSRKSKESE